jgi:release factor glutamine methyltransferase
LAGIYPAGEIDSLIILIFENLKGYSRTQFLLASESILDNSDRHKIDAITSRLKNHEPIQYILGETEFYGLKFKTIPGVLIPRPETEELVHWIIQENQVSSPTILDVGTGTGCIAISISKNIPQASVQAFDISAVCIETARQNAILNQTAVSVFEYDILNSQPENSFPECDIIVSNPPYITEAEKNLMEKNVLDFEPELALFVPNLKPLIFYEKIARFAQTKLKNGGLLYFEINEAYGLECTDLLVEMGFSEVTLRKDLHGKDRMVRGKLLR